MAACQPDRLPWPNARPSRRRRWPSCGWHACSLHSAQRRRRLARRLIRRIVAGGAHRLQPGSATSARPQDGHDFLRSACPSWVNCVSFRLSWTRPLVLQNRTRSNQIGPSRLGRERTVESETRNRSGRPSEAQVTATCTAEKYFSLVRLGTAGGCHDANTTGD